MEDLISKRELLERYGVSYGALYRWKRQSRREFIRNETEFELFRFDPR